MSLVKEGVLVMYKYKYGGVLLEGIFDGLIILIPLFMQHILLKFFAIEIRRLELWLDMVMMVHQLSRLGVTDGIRKA